jgi:hypothetical protein
MAEWISVKDRPPKKGQKVKIRAGTVEIIDAEAVFNIYDIDEFHEAWGWNMDDENYKIFGTLRPTHWAELPSPPEI